MLSTEQELLVGFVSGVASRLITIPLAVITVHLQSDPDGYRKDGSFGGPTISSVVQHIYEEQGLAGFWSGR